MLINWIYLLSNEKKLLLTYVYFLCKSFACDFSSSDFSGDFGVIFGLLFIKPYTSHLKKWLI